MTERGAENRGKTSSFKKEGLCWRTNKLRFEKISPTISANYENWFLEDILRKAESFVKPELPEHSSGIFSF